MEKHYKIRLCGSSWYFCNGDCINCENANITTNNSTTIQSNKYTYAIKTEE